MHEKQISGQQDQETPLVNVDLQGIIAQMQGGDAKAVAEAIAFLEAVVEQQADNPLAFLGLGIARARQGQLDEAQALFERAVAVDPKLASAWTNLGNLHKLHGRREAALEAYRKSIALQPGFADAHYNLSLVLDEMGQREEAEESVRRALLFRPNYSEAHNNLGHLLLKSGKMEQAVSHFRQALVWDTKQRQARFNLIVALYRLNRNAEAQSEVDQLLSDNPDDAQVLRVQAAGLAQQGRFDDAEAVNTKLLEIDPEAVDAQLNRGELMLARQDYEGALACYRELLAQRSVAPAIGIGAMANVMLARGDFSAARDMFQQALMMNARLPSLTLGLAKAFLGAGEVALGLQTLRRVTELLPNSADIQSLLIQHLPLNEIDGEKLRSSEIIEWRQHHCREDGIRRAVSTIAPKEGKPLRVGILIGDTEEECVIPGLCALFEQLDKQRIDIYIYHVGGRLGRHGTRLQAATAHWRPAASLGAGDLAEQVRQDAIDIWIDRIGHGPGSRLQAFAEQPAPMQISWATDGADAGLPQLDWKLTDAVLEPVLEAKTVYLPAPFVYTAPEDAPALSQLSAGDNLILGVLSPLAHMNPVVLDAWAKILQHLPNARLRLVSGLAASDEATRERLKRLFLLREVEPERLEILPRATDRALYWQSLAGFDFVLDTFPVSLGTQVLDCLWMGVPVLTLAGTNAPGRLAASLLAQVDLADWAAHNKEEYVERAIAAAAAKEDLARLRLGLRERLTAAPAMDSTRFARAFETAVSGMWATAAAHPGKD